MKTKKERFIVEDDDGNEVELSSHLVVCQRCEGKGVHDHPAFSNGLRPEETEDPDFMEDYMRGTYDVPCEECGGLRVVAAPDEAALSDDEKRWLNNRREAQASARAERRMRERGIEF